MHALATLTPLSSPRLASARERYLDLARGTRRGARAAALRLLLRLASWPYGLAVRLRNLAYDRGWKKARRAAVPVVSVGNLTVGGTGKTPMVEFVARFYRGHDRRVAVLSRGYGSDEGRNDEALVLEENLPDVPHLQGADRAELAGAAVEELESEVLVLDDGFQHRRLARDLDIVLLDATDPLGASHLLPRGLLREPLSGLRRADAVVLTRCDQVDAGSLEAFRRRVERLAPGKVVAEAVHRPVALVSAGGVSAPLEQLRNRPVAAFCGIGNPEAFRRTLAALGAELVDFRTFPDHHPYSRADVESLRAQAGRLPAGALVVTTQKDLVKLRLEELAGRPLWAVGVELAIVRGGVEMERLLLRLLRE